MTRKTIIPILGLAMAMALISACATAPEPSSFNGNTNQILTLIDEGGDVNGKDSNGRTLLMSAAIDDNPDGIKILLHNGADIHAMDAKGKSAIDHAFDHGNGVAFKTLLENGGRFDSSTNASVAVKNKRKSELYRMAEEYKLVKTIQARKNDLKLYDRYFSLFYGGAYQSKVESMLQERAGDEFKQVSKSNSAASWRRFMKRYKKLGQSAHEITVNKLYIRKKDSTRSQSQGHYEKGKIVYAKAERHGWLLTDKGWISGIYTKPQFHKIRVLQPYLQEGREKLRKLESPKKRLKKKRVRKSKPKRKPKPKPVSKPKAEPQPEPPALEPAPSIVKLEPIIEESEEDSVQTEFNQIMQSNSEQDVLRFIKTYKDDSDYVDFVQQARKKYIMMIRKLPKKK